MGDQLTPGQSMRDGTAERLIAEIVQLHEALIARRDHAEYLAALGPGDNTGPISGTPDHDATMARAQAMRQAVDEWQRQRKNALERLREVIRHYEIALGQRRPPRAPIQSIDYRAGGHRRVG